MKSRNWPTILQRFWDFAGGVSVRMKIFGIVLGSTLLLSLGFALQVRIALFNMLEHESKEQGTSIARDVAARATDMILINDIYSLHQLLIETQANFHDVRYAFILNQSGDVLVHTFGTGFPLGLIAANNVAPNTYQHTESLKTDEGIIWDVAVPIFGGNAGTARIGISDLSVRQTLAGLTTQLMLTILGVLAVSLLAATLLTWILTRPILELVEATRIVAKGDFSPQVRRWANDEIGDLAEAFNQMTTKLARMDEIQHEREQLRRKLLESVITAQEEERRRIARELHDSTSQSLTSLMVGLRTLEACCDKPQIYDQVMGLRRVVSQTLDEVHSLAVQLRPAVLDDLGLAAALERFVDDWQDHHGITADLLIHLGDKRLPEAIETALYRIIQESLTNVTRHAKARTVSVLVERRQEDVVAVIEDDGRGFEIGKPRAQERLGLLGIRERAELLGGRITLESSVNQGTSLFVFIPLPITEASPLGKPA